MPKGLGFLASVGLACAGLLATTNWLTAERIADNKRAHEIRQITELAGIQPTTEPQWVDGVWQLCNGTVLVKAQTVGYGGPMAAVLARQDQHLRDLRVTAHQETPGIADFVSRPDDPWRQRLRGLSLPDLAEVDAVAGATITSDALLALVSDALDRSINVSECSP